MARSAAFDDYGTEVRAPQTVVRRRMRRRLPVLVIAGATVLAAVAAYRWTASGLLPITGDEPHYLIIAASVLRDGDFEVGNDYEHDASANEICDCELVRHALQRATGWWPQHMPGLGVLLALPFGAGGAVGGRVGLALLVVPVLGVALYLGGHPNPAINGHLKTGHFR